MIVITGARGNVGHEVLKQALAVGMKIDKTPDNLHVIAFASGPELDIT